MNMLYHNIITNATGITDEKQVQQIEDFMRDIVFGHPLDSIPREDLENAARLSVITLTSLGEV